MLTKDPQRCGTVIAIALNLVKLLAIIVEPYMPSLSAKIYTQLNFKEKLIGDTFELSLPAGHEIGTPQVLFRELKDKDVAEYRSKYGGAQQKASDSFPADIRGIF